MLLQRHIYHQNIYFKHKILNWPSIQINQTLTIFKTRMVTFMSINEAKILS